VRIAVVAVLGTTLASGCAAGLMGGREWRSATPEAQRLDASRLRALVGRMERGTYGEMSSLLIVRHGRLVVERYFRGAGPDDPQPLQSVTKSVTSVLVGIAMDQGRIPRLDAPVADFLPNCADLVSADPRKGAIVLEHLLTMTSGLAWIESAPPLPWPGQPADWLRVVLQQPVVDEPGTRFSYSSGSVLLLSGVLQRLTGRRTEDLAVRALFRPLDFGAHDWPALEGDLTPTGSGLALRPRDLAKIGQLYLDGGVYRGRRIVSEAWVRRSTAAHATLPDGTRYGYLWWLLPATPLAGDSLLRSVFYAGGAGDQYLFVVPAADVVVVVTGQNYERHFVRPLAFLTAEILPAISDSR